MPGLGQGLKREFFNFCFDKCDQYCYILVMIITFKDKVTKKVFDGVKIKRIDKNILKKARRRLELLNAAKKIEDLYFPPSNNFHSLEGHKPTRYAIRVSSQWRISFEWHDDANAYNVYFEDYH